MVNMQALGQDWFCNDAPRWLFSSQHAGLFLFWLTLSYINYNAHCTHKTKHLNYYLVRYHFEIRISVVVNIADSFLWRHRTTLDAFPAMHNFNIHEEPSIGLTAHAGRERLPASQTGIYAWATLRLEMHAQCWHTNINAILIQ